MSALRKQAGHLGARSRGTLYVAAISSGSRGQRPQGPAPDPFDRHASARDKQQQKQNNANRANVRRSSSSSFGANRRRGRPAHLRSPDDSPLRDGNRDRLIGLLTERAARTLLVYLQETNPTVYHWLFTYIHENPIPLQGSWDEVSGETFLRKMLSTPAETATLGQGRDALFNNMATIGVDPRHMAQRIMEVRVQLSKEFVQDLSMVADENNTLLRETLQASMTNSLAVEPIRQLPPREPPKVFVHPELLTESGSLHPEVAKSHPELLPVVARQQSKSPSPEPSSSSSSKSPSPGPATPQPSPPPPSLPSASSAATAAAAPATTPAAAAANPAPEQPAPGAAAAAAAATPAQPAAPAPAAAQVPANGAAAPPSAPVAASVQDAAAAVALPAADQSQASTAPPAASPGTAQPQSPAAGEASA